MADEAPEIGHDRAVVDRIVDGRTAVLLVGPDEVELLLAVEALPEGVGEGTWVVLEACADPPDPRLRIDEQLTQQRFDDLAVRMDTLRSRRRGGRFER